MLQQTQVARVEGYYKNFLGQFPDFNALAKAKTGEVLKVWQGLGYNRRGIFLKKCAERIVNDFGGRLPHDRKALESLPGIGKGTSGSLMAFAFNKPEIFIETNIRRVFIHFFFEDKMGVTDEELKRYIESSVDRTNAREWYWALMDYGASMATIQKDRIINPNRRSAHYKKQSIFSGSDRQLRGKVLRALLSGDNKLAEKELFKILNTPRTRFIKIIKDLENEGFIVRKRNYICIK
jgi:A/G-specific adenine glycosylase